ncbi:MAG TPA: GGDEF domain-containing protein, partial [Solirubrobacteraceae bacterium]|nr:GGDEF domain-containing protein [Solirubrobacteraceae bacterium]
MARNADTAEQDRVAIAARRAAILFAIAGSLAIVQAWMPGLVRPEQRLDFALLGLLDLVAGGLLLALPWRRLPAGALAIVPVTALVLVDAFAIVGELPPAVYSVFLVLLAAWVGVSLPGGTAVALTPAVALAYAAPLAAGEPRADALATGAIVLPAFALIGELLAHIVGELRTANLRLAEAALHDELTGTGNRRQAMDALQRVRPGDALLVLDVDHFKQVNDHHGHATGDAVLASLGALLRRGTAGADTVARLGGEEFLIILAQAGTNAAAIADRMLGDWRATRPATTLSIGIAVVEAG